MNISKLIAKYDVPVPRYTSYPTVPYWSENPSIERWLAELRGAILKPETSWSLYLHIPFCETLCTFCGCNTTITKNHDRENPYIRALLAEWQTYLKEIPQLRDKPLRQLHLGGGTPTFLSAENLRGLLTPILSKIKKAENGFDASIEVDPRRTSEEQLQVLYALGFRRVSMGVQDFNHEVQRLVNRIQPLELTKNLTEAARRLGYESINYDLIYGLPKQTLESFSESVRITIELKPDRIALYSFALVPWIKPQQRLFKDEDLPVAEEKRQLYEAAREQLLAAGYIEIGMDHFALPTDALARASQSGDLHRNFMGYTDLRTDVLLGLGVSAISEVPSCFHQNEKILPVYEKKVLAGEVPTLRGHLLSKEDRQQREKILDLMTRSQVKLNSYEEIMDIEKFLGSLIHDGLVKIEQNTLHLTPQGRPFLRNACVAFDLRLRRGSPQTRIFSQSI